MPSTCDRCKKLFYLGFDIVDHELCACCASVLEAILQTFFETRKSDAEFKKYVQERTMDEKEMECDRCSKLFVLGSKFFRFRICAQCASDLDYSNLFREPRQSDASFKKYVQERTMDEKEMEKQADQIDHVPLLGDELGDREGEALRDESRD